MEEAIAKPVNMGCFNRNQIKYIVVIAMLLDHIAWGCVDDVNLLLGGCMHFAGRLTGPTMAYFAGEGYFYTKDVSRYHKRLAFCAMISWPAFVYFEYGSLLLYFENGYFIL